MNIALLFDSQDRKYEGEYGCTIRDTILKTGVLQKSNRHMKIAIGDILVKPQNLNEVQAYRKAIILDSSWRKLVYPKIIYTHVDNIFAWVVYNATEAIALELHTALLADSSYMGTHSVEFSYLPQLVAYRLIMVPKYRIAGDTCRIFYSMSDHERKDNSEQDTLLRLGFNLVTWEDTGAHQTIFDDFDTHEHFKEINEFEMAITPYLPNGQDEAGELTMLIGDFNPKLFATLGALVRTYARARNAEELAQVGLSARRYLEQLADVLFEPREDPYNDMEVTKARHKNRIRAYIDIAIPKSDPLRDSKSQSLNKEMMRLFDEVNSILHANATNEKVGGCFAGLAKLTASLLTLNPEISGNPYFAFSSKLDTFPIGDS